MSMSIRVRLSLMMLLEYAIWGAWAPVLYAYLVSAKPDGLGLTDPQASWIYNALPIASIVAPFLTGQLADRFFATERFMGVLHLIGGALLIVAAGQKTFGGMMGCMLLVCLVYAPTLALTNSLAFSHMKDSDKEFGGIRVWGTIGWILSGLLLTYFRNSHPTFTPAGMTDTLYLAGILGILLGLLSFGLPHTPPKKEGVNPMAFLDALKLLQDRNFLVFILISFVVATELQFYYLLTAPFLQQRMGVAQANVPGIMTTAQIAEIVVMAVLLPMLLPKMGLRKTMVLGIIAWPIRYVIFAIGASAGASMQTLVVASLTLHGFCYVFFFTVGFMYVDKVAHSDIRASAQSLIAIVVLGLGSFFGNIITGWIADIFKDPASQTTNWTGVFLVPCVLTVVCAAVFPALFREHAQPTKAAGT